MMNHGMNREGRGGGGCGVLNDDLCRKLKYPVTSKSRSQNTSVSLRWEASLKFVSCRHLRYEIILNCSFICLHVCPVF